MGRRRPGFPLIAVVVIVLLATGCVQQPVDEARLGDGAQLAEVAAPLVEHEAEQLVDAVLQREEPKRVRRRRRTHPTATRAPHPTVKAAVEAQGAGDAGKSSRRAREHDDPVAKARTAAFVELAGFADRAGDASGESPDYADVEGIVIDSDGTTARVTVVFAGSLPPALAVGEVQGVGIDVYRSAGRESDYQLFADGGERGWRAFLHTPDGVMAFPGTFRVGGQVMVFEVPWTALGGAEPADVTVFCDWSRQRTLLAAAGNDRAPNSGRVAVRPRRR